jgi:N-6 DNA methylase
MKAFGPYTCELETLALETTANTANTRSDERIRAALDGGPATELRSVVPLEVVRADGAFFTGNDLAKRLISSIESQLADGAVVSDLACGTGNLLTACAYHLPMGGDITQTLELWGRYLRGTDIHDEFVRTTKARLALVALDRGAVSGAEIALEDAFPQIRLGDAFEQTEIISEADCITLNPPFTIAIAPTSCAWASGKVSTAALMLEAAILNAKPGARIVAILPDVLRTGSHYLRWRMAIERIAQIESVEVVGLFDVWTDVDVFILRLTVRASDQGAPADWWKSNREVRGQSERFRDLFEIRVGPVVPHRDPHLGSWHPFIHARDLPVWKSVNIDSGFSCRRFTGTTYTPPFVVVRRTSRPGDKNRAVGTVIRGKRTVAVENHLVVLKPRDGSLRRCLESLERLQSADTNVWLNERIRCRHLTVSSIGEIPWWK